ncbi:GNAT family N-acetyltransferase [Bradyrhizobium prioriisuperbiae]|uniref:GNAT family N-acetyltransferase n=1 Tax=Bradyrhizobium prioriisuperbiae TaxID=2854389 RepID=UPI0028E54DD5|nr:GNAT family N-acetyltransferase [Bradyrhizobium prioritasuperba]
MELGEVLVARIGDEIVGHLQIVETERADEFDLKSMAVDEARQRQGIGEALMRAAVDHCRRRGGHRLIVSTAAASTGTLHFYQRLGFRMFRIVRDAFRPESGYAMGISIDGIPLRDQVYLDLDI